MQGHVITAVPGSGKTHTLIEKCYELMVNEGVDNVVAITFTERAASQLMSRLKEKAKSNNNIDLLKKLPDSKVGTIHNFCSTILRDYGEMVGLPRNFVVMDDIESFYFMEKVVREYLISIQELQTTSQWKNLQIVEELFGVDIEDIIRWITDIMDSHRGYFTRMILTENSFYSKLSTDSFTKDVMKEILSRFTLSIIPYLTPIIQGLVNHYQELKRVKGLQDFDDLLIYSLKVSRKIGKELAERYRFVLIDEFQDTDEVQVEIFKNFLENGSFVFTVGDPFQSIYSFRGAHPEAQEELSNLIDSRSAMDENRRSRPKLIEFYNQLFPPALGSIKMKAYNTGEGAVSIFAPDDLFPMIAEIVKEKIRKGTKPGEIAILSRTATGFLKLKRHLRDEGIETVTVSGESIMKSQEGLDIYNLLRYLADPGDKVALIGILFSPLFNYDVTQVFFNKYDLDRIVGEKLGKYREMLNSERIEFVVQSILINEGYFVPQENDAQSYEKNDRIWRIITMLSSFVDIYGGGIYDVIKWFENVKESRDSGPIDDVLEDDTRVKIMTIHQAKGLEFNSVIVFGLDSGRDNEKYFVDPALGLIIKKNFGFFNSPSRKIIDASNRSKYLNAEERRIMYVAFTRAKEELDILIERSQLLSEKQCDKDETTLSILQRAFKFFNGQSEQEIRGTLAMYGINNEPFKKTPPLTRENSQLMGISLEQPIPPDEKGSDDRLNSMIIREFVNSRGEKIGQFRVATKGGLVTTTDKGTIIYEKEKVKGAYFVEEGKVEFII